MFFTDQPRPVPLLLTQNLPPESWRLLASCLCHLSQENHIFDMFLLMIGHDRTTGAVKHQQSTSKIIKTQPQGVSAIDPAVWATGISSSLKIRLFSMPNIAKLRRRKLQAETQHLLATETNARGLSHVMK